jgi:hypothetical protein
MGAVPVPYAPIDPPLLPSVENPRASACSTTANPSAPGATASVGVIVKLSCQGAVRSNWEGDQAAFACPILSLVMSRAPPHSEGSACVAPCSPVSAHAEKSTAGDGAQGAAHAVAVAREIAWVHRAPPVAPVKPKMALLRLPTAALRFTASWPL